jgi:GNAT superfamily N-acetyltransferase
VTLRPLVPRDEDRLIRLFNDIPYEELRDLHDDVSHPLIVRRWCRHINYDRVLPLVAELDRRIIADATLHRRGFGPAREVGRFRVYVRPEYRRRGLGAVLLQEIMDLARRLGLKRLAVELYEDQVLLQAVFRRYGFVEDARLPVYQRVILVREISDEAIEADELGGAEEPDEEAHARTHQG